MKELPDSLAEPYRLISDDYTYILYVYKLYRQLYGHSEKRVDLLNKSAPSFFEATQIALLDFVILGICKLLDPAKSAKNKNASLEWLEVLLIKNNNEPLAVDLAAMRKKLNQRSANLRKTRSKRIAHNDLAKAKLAQYYPHDISRKDISVILKSIGDYLNKIDEHYTKSTFFFDISMDGDGEILLHLLSNGLRYEELIENGSIKRDDEVLNPFNDYIGEPLEKMDGLN